MSKVSGLQLAAARRKFRDMRDRVNAPDGGFSVDARTGIDQSGDVWMASQAGTEAKFDRPVRTSEVVRFVRKNRESLNRPGAHVGGWNDRGSPTLDVSFAHTDLAKARKFAKKNKQDAIYNPARGETRYSPNY